MRRSILTERIARRGHHIWREYTIDPFLQTRVGEIMAQPVDTLPAAMPATEAIAYFTAPEGPARHKSYPVVDGSGHLVGMVARADILRWTRDGLDDGVTLRDLSARDELLSARVDDLVGDLADRMAAADTGRVPILARGSDKVVGLVARRDLLRVRALAIRAEQERGRVLRLPSVSRRASS